MKHPSIRLRTIVGSAMSAAIILLIANYSIYQTVRNSLHGEIEARLQQSASLLSASPELEAGKIVYEWHEAMLSGNGPPITGIFQFWDVASGNSIRSPELGNHDLPRFHGRMDQADIRDIHLADGTPAKAIGLLHRPFVDASGKREMERLGIKATPDDFPQILVCAVETRSVEKQLSRLRNHLFITTIATVAGIWLSVFFISRRTLRPIDELSARLMKRTSSESEAPPEISARLPRELISLATAFNTTLQRVEDARIHERDFALHAAHELRTPIAGIHAILQQAVHRPRAVEDLKNRIGSALAITQEMKATINSLMLLARLRGGIESIRREPFATASLLQEATDRESSRYPGKPYETDFTPEPLVSDAGLFRLLASNLIENAFRHATPEIPITVISKSTPEGLRLAVTNGRGSLSPADAERIFRPFQRGSGTSADSTGAGLGLPLAKEIARLLGGELHVEFDDEERVTFVATIPGR